jgi:hypothetical protein
MRKLGITLSIVVSSIFFINGAIAQNKPLACQGDASTGLNWEQGRWVMAKFQTKKFILVQTGNTLTIDSVAKAIGNEFPKQISCTVGALGNINCKDNSGTSLVFEPKTLKGGVAHIYGAAWPGDKTDSVTVEVFSCTPF